MTNPNHHVFAVITGGGTSGHVIPALAIAELLQDSGYSLDQLHYVGSTSGIETSLVPPTKMAMSLLAVQGFSRRISLRALQKNISTVKVLRNATKQAEALLETLQPRIVISVGGYVSVPTARAAKNLGIPTLTVSYDRQPGLATRQQARSASAVAVAYLPSDLKKATLTGAPVRRVIRNLDIDATRSDARTRLGLPQDRKVVCVTGGSLGSAALNAVARQFVEGNQSREDICLIHLTGQRYINEDRPEFEPGAKITYKRLESTVAMQDVYSASDLVVARAGASTVAEISTIGIASVLVPWAQAAEDHQTANANWLGELGGAIVIDEKAFSTVEIAAQITALIDDNAKISALGLAARKAGAQHRNTSLASLIIETAQQTKSHLDLASTKRIHVVGVGGPGMSAIATVLAEMGHIVSGSDVRQSEIIDRLQQVGVQVNLGHKASVVEDCDFVTGSPAIAASNIEYQHARSIKVAIATRAQTLAQICKRATSIGVAGTHGKTTTSSMLATILISAR
ncbi:MAG: UDP-N-acetylglucosamine--N-acetylmuramyl-(pentapeptide) pyrophosphoryl-undecaprenol, partial [Actinomycetota bacterium]